METLNNIVSEYKIESNTNGITCDRGQRQGFIGLHIGAGSHSRSLQNKYRALCARACRQGTRLLTEGKSALDVVEQVTKLLEDSPLTNAGRGSCLNMMGRVEGDASVMCGKSLHWAGVGAVPGVRNPVMIAKALCDQMDKSQLLGRITPCLLVGNGARRWARQHGISLIHGKHLISDRSLKSYNKYKTRLQQCKERLDTVGVVALDTAGDVAAACSSGGIALKDPGRVGQAAVYGSGAWAQNGEPSVAVTTSGCGEHLVRSSLARGVVSDVPNKECPTTALHTAMYTHFLDSPFLRDVTAPLGGLTFLQHSPESESGDFLWSHSTKTMCIGYMSTMDAKPFATVSQLPAEVSPGKGAVVHGVSFRTYRRDS